MKCLFVIPTFNSEETISLCLDSIISEKEDNDEIVVVDNGSSDKTLEIVSNYKSVIVKILTNGNISAVRNFGAKQVSADIIAFIDSDCVLDKSWRNNANRVLNKNDVHATGSKVKVPQESTWIEKVWFAQNKSGEFEVNYINSGNFVVKYDVFNELSGFDENLVTGEDSEFCFRITKNKYKIVSSDSVGVVHLDNPKTIIQFIKKQYWHSLGMFGTFKVNKFDKPLLATFAFILFHVGGIIMMLNHFFLWAILLFLLVPLFSVFFRLIQYKIFNYILPLILLYYFYFLARSSALLVIRRTK